MITSKTKENQKNYLKWGWVINISQGKLTFQTLDGMILNDLNEKDIQVEIPKQNDECLFYNEEGFLDWGIVNKIEDGFHYIWVYEKNKMEQIKSNRLAKLIN